MTSWEDIYGEKCVECDKPASHYWGVTPICCQCHGGGLFTAKETASAHDKVRIDKLITKQKERRNVSEGDH